MHLRSITIKGFKSFPDRTRLEFGPGVSVIVGPNGSGKSNITDAVLWALGEQSPVAVRGQSMQDVIFAGAPGRKASSSAEVELVLEDSDGSLGLGATEVSIARRLDRSGEGEYRLSGARCRLVDVIEVLSDTGLGKEMHSVISQGRVESLVTSKPRDRRLLIEEAAGLGKHRKRRRRAQLKLERTQDNLDRALDVEREARSRLRALKRQAEAAELHARLERQALEVRWELGRGELRELGAELACAQEGAERSRARREQLERDLAEVAERREAAEELLAGRSARREELSRRCFTAQSAAERLSYRAEAMAGAVAVLDERLARHREALGALRTQAPPTVPDQEAAERIALLARELAQLERRREHSVAEQVTELQARRADAEATVAERSAAVEAESEARQRAEALAQAAQDGVRKAERAVEETRLEAAHAGGELAAVNHFLTIQSARSERPTLADQLDVDPGYELAVAAALDGRLRAAVVEDQAAGMALLDQAGADGASALVAGARPRSPGGAATAAPGAAAECLADHVRGPAGALELAHGLLDGIWVLDSLEHVPEGFEGVAVTRAGRVWSPLTGELRQAPSAGEERVLAERNRREQLVAASERAAQAELAAAAELERAASERARLESERELAFDSYRQAVRARDEAVEEEQRLAEAIERRRSAPLEGEEEMRRRAVAAELDGERGRAEHSRQQEEARRSRLERLERATEVGQQLLPEIRAIQEALRTLGEVIAARQANFEQELIEDRQAGEEVAAQLRACAQEEAGIQAALHATGEDLTQAEVGLQRALDRVAASREELEGIARKLELEATPAEEELGDEQREALRARLERLARRREQLGPVNPLAQDEYAEAVEHVEELERQRTDLETALKELERLIADTDRQIRESFEQTFEAAAENFEHVVAELFPGGKGRLRLVAERDGPARVLGGGEAPDQEDGTEDSPEQEEAEAREEELLGVEIEINPAGKEMRRLSLLSGGEKSLTALAFLFAVFLARPCPFYILDEVEAALDDLNIDRFLGMLRAYSGRAQFVVVTHQKRTMEAADYLYGVSMGGDGISKVISRRLPQEVQAAA
jgi:chromosome segregation protein